MKYTDFKLKLFEAIDAPKIDQGSIEWLKTSLSDPHIKEIIANVSQETGVSEELIEAEMQVKMGSLNELHKHSPMLYETIASNLAEAIAFEYIAKAANRLDPNKRVKFDPQLFERLINTIRLEHPGMFPLKAPLEINVVEEPLPIYYVPSNDPKLKRYNSCTTAMVTSEGNFVFNKDFMQNLLDFAVIKGLKPKGQKFKSNGGFYPDAYAYLEFLIMHEIYHYMEGDFKTALRYPQFSRQIWNIATDLRSNYDLVKRGYTQLPIGYFSKHLNHDKQGSIYTIMKLVKDEMDKLPDHLKKFVEDHATDDHPGSEGKPWVPQVGDIVEMPDGSKGVITATDGKRSQVKKLEESGNAKLTEHKVGEIESYDNHDLIPWGAKLVPGKNKIDPDKVHEKTKKMLDKRSESSGHEDPKDPKDSKGAGSSSDAPDAIKGGVALSSREDEIKSIKPKKTWKQILSTMITSAVENTISSWARPARSIISRIPAAKTTGSIAIKPSEKISEEEQLKICLVFDTSGSMYKEIPTVLSNAHKLLEQVGKSDFPIGIMFFADSYSMYKINLAKNTYSPISNVADMSKTTQKNTTQKNWKNLLTSASSGGTSFNGEIISDISSLCAKGYNIMIFTDSDIIYGQNLESLQHLYNSYKNQIYVCAKDKGQFESIIRNLFNNQIVPHTFTHL